MAERKRILIYRLGSLGDTVMALPCFHLVKDTYPDAEIVLLTNKPVASKAAPLEAVLGEKGYFFDRIINYPIGTRNPLLLLSLILQIRALKIDTMVNLTAARSKKSALRDKVFFALAGIKTFIGFPEREQDFTVSIDARTGLYEWEADRLRNRLNQLGEIDLQQPRYWDLKLSEVELTKADNLLKPFPTGTKYLAVCAGTKMQSKDWGAENWLRLMKQLGAQLPDRKLVMIGAAEESELGDQCLSAWGGEGLNLCGKSSPRVSAAVLQKADLFIGHDSGPMHLAACVGTPCVAVFAAINRPRQWFPRGDANRIIYHETECAGCKLSTCIEQKKKCVLSITVAEVEEAVLASLDVNSGILSTLKA